MSMSCRFFLTLVRHGETVENRENIIQGQADTSLSELGNQQAVLVARRLQNERFTHMYSSDLSRAAYTAKAIAEANQLSSCKIAFDKRLRERSFGVMQGKKFRDLQNMMKEKNTSFKSFTPEGGETLEQVTKRASSFFNDTCNMVLKTAIDPKTSQSPGGSSSTDQHQSNGSTMQSDRENGERKQEQSFVARVSDRKDIASNSSQSQQKDVVGSEIAFNILIVSHGLLLKELKRLIMDRFRGKLSDDIAAQSQRVSPNTGVSKFEMSVSNEGGKMNVKCIDCCFLNSAAHLQSSRDNLVTEAKYDTISNT